MAFYSSDLGDLIVEGMLNIPVLKTFRSFKIKIDTSLMLVPIDDRMINRAHGCFDALTVHNFRFRDVSV